MRSLELHKRAQLSIAHGSLTNSKRPASYVKGVYPSHLVSGNGAFVLDNEGHRLVDFIAGLGANLYGYAHPGLTEIGIKAEKLGMNLSLGTPYEIELAEKIKEYFTFIDRVRFLKTGSEACSASIKIARAFTKRSRVLSHGYHGQDAEFVSLTPPAYGCNPTDKMSAYDIMSLDDTIAAVIVEPVITDFSEARKAELVELRAKCTAVGALLIFDEVITALRFPGLCVAKYFGVTPDLIVFGKALGGGSSISCVGGRKDVMETDYFVSSTYAGELAGIMKAKAVLDMVKSKNPIERLWEFGSTFWNDFNTILDGIVSYQGYPTRGILAGDEMKKAIFMQEACKAGLLFGASPFLMFPHIELREQILSVLKDVATKIKTSGVKLEGQMPVKTIVQKQRE